MYTFKDDILDAAGGEEIIAVVIGKMGWDDYKSENVPMYDQQPKGEIIDWEAAAPLLDYEYSTGFGAPECNAIYAWTDTRVIFVSQYDGSTMLVSIPRNPTNEMPQMPGGG